MGRAGVAVHTIVDVPGRSRAEVSSVVAAAMSDDAAYEMASVGPDTYQLVRTYRPTWALVAGGAGLIVFGLGILLLLVRRTESCTLVVTDGATGSTIALTGSLLPGRVEALREALERSVTPPGRPEAPTAALAPSAIDRPSMPAPGPILTVPAPAQAAGEAHSSLVLAGGPAGAVDQTVMARPRMDGPAVRPGSLAVKLDDGRLVALDRRVLVGRDPAPGTRDVSQPVHLVPVSDPQMRVSKTHLAIAMSNGSAWVEDLHSTNGTTVEQPGGVSLPVAPGAPVSLRPGSVVHFGGLRAEVVAGV
jgi:hypothetical protein